MLEVLDANVANFVFEQVVCHALNFDDGADDGELSRLREALAHDPDDDLATGFSSKFPDGISQAHVDRRFIADADDTIERSETYFGSGCAGHGAHDSQEAIAVLDDDPQTSKLTSRVDLHVFVVRGRQKVGVGVECFEHPVDGGKFDLAELNIAFVVFLNEGKDRFELVTDVKDRLEATQCEAFDFAVDVYLEFFFMSCDKAHHDRRDEHLNALDRFSKHLFGSDLFALYVVFIAEPGDATDVCEVEKIVSDLGMCTCWLERFSEPACRRDAEHTTDTKHAQEEQKPSTFSHV